MEPSEYISAFRKRWLVIVTLTILGCIAGYFYAQSLPQQYRSSTSVFVSTQQGGTTSELVQGSQYAQDAVQSYSQLATMPAVLDGVIDELGLSTSSSALAKQLTATAALDTVIIQISAVDTDPQLAADISQTVAESLSAVAEDFAPTNSDGDPAIRMSVVSSAQVPSAPIGPNKPLYLGIGGILGLVLAVLYAIGRQLLDTRVRNEDDLSRTSDAPLLGSISRNDRKVSGIVLRTAPHSVIAEQYRRLRTNLEFADVDNGVGSVTVTSALPGEGKTTTAINLALAMAEKSAKVLLIDADLRNPSVAQYTGLDGEVGLTSVLVGTATVKEAIQAWGDSGVQVLPSGAIPPNPNQLIGSAAMAGLIANLVRVYDFVVIDSPPLIPVTDSLTMAQLTDGAVVVARNNATRRQEFTRAVDSLRQVNARVLGLVLNQAPPVTKHAYYGHDGSSSLQEDVTPAARIAKLRSPAIRPSAKLTGSPSPSAVRVEHRVAGDSTRTNASDVDEWSALINSK